MINASASSRCFFRSSIQRSTQGYPLQMMPKCSRRIRRKWTWDVIKKKMEKAKDALQIPKKVVPKPLVFLLKISFCGVFGYPYFWKHHETPIYCKAIWLNQAISVFQPPQQKSIQQCFWMRQAPKMLMTDRKASKLTTSALKTTKQRLLVPSVNVSYPGRGA